MDQHCIGATQRELGTRAEPWSVGQSVSTKSGVPKTGHAGSKRYQDMKKSFHSTSGTLRSCGGSLLSVRIEDPNKSTRPAPKWGATTWVMPTARAQELPTGATCGSSITEDFPLRNGSIFTCHPKSGSTNLLWFASYFRFYGATVHKSWAVTI